MSKSTKGAVILLLSALGFGMLPLFALYAYKSGINLTTLLFIRFSLGAVLFFVYVFFKNHSISVNKKDLIALAVLGGICYNLQSRLYFSSVKHIPSTLAALFLYTYPVMVAALSFVVDREKPTGKVGLSIAVSFSGLVMILGASFGKIDTLGMVMALGAAFVYSIYIVIGNRVVKKTPPLVTSAFVALFSAVGVFGLGAFSEGLDFHFAGSTWFPILGLVLFSTVMAMLFFFRGMELLGPTRASVLSMTEPVFTFILSTLILHDRLTFIQLAGGILVLTGSIGVMWVREKNKTASDTAAVN